MKTGTQLEVVAEALDVDGRGVCAGDVRIMNLLPGERALAVIEHVSPHGKGAWGAVLRQLGDPSPSRVEPPCPMFGRCGGCAWQHLSIAEQLAEKRAVVERALAAQGIDAQVAPVQPSPHEVGYRNKGKYVAGRGSSGVFVLGSYMPRSHQVVSTVRCAIVEPAIAEVAAATHAAVLELGLEPYDEKTGTGALRYVLVRSGVDSRVVVTLVTRSDAPASLIEAIAAALVEGTAATGVLWAKNDRGDGGLLQSEPRLVLGHGAVGEQLAGHVVDLDPNTFWQINRDQAERIYERIAALVGDFGSVLDAYAGVGAIGLAAARRGAAVTTVEIDEVAVQCTRQAAARAGLTVNAIAGDASVAIGDGNGSYDAIIVNPPRRGLSADVRNRLARARPARLVYLSCGPESLARDLAELIGAGAVIESVEPFDMMPGTGQIETLVSLRF